MFAVDAKSMRASWQRTAAASLGGAMMLVAGAAHAFELDGIVTAGVDSYTSSFGLTFDLEGKNGDKTVTGGVIRVGQDGPSGNVFMLFEIPTDVVDNVYGDAAGTAGSGWVKPDGSPQGHSLGDLLGSDKLEFDIGLSGGGTHSVSVDYDLETDVDGTGTGVVGYRTSLQLNLINGFNDSNDNSPDPILGLSAAEAADWVQAVQYELEIDGSLFDPGTTVSANDLENIFLHASPNKGKFKNQITVSCTGGASNCGPTTNPPPPGTNVPEPGVLSLLGAGLLGLAFYRRRRLT